MSKTQVFYWRRCFVLRSCDFAQDGRDKPYQRLAATLIVSLGEPFSIRINDQATEQHRVALVPPDARRHELRFNGSESFMFDAGLSHPAFQRLRPVLRNEPLHMPGHADAVFAALQDLPEHLDCGSARQLFTKVINAVAPEENPTPIDPRIQRIQQLIDANPRDTLSVAALARAVDLSESRLRSLAQRHLGCSLARYMRWIAAWRAAEIWRPGMSFTEVAHAAGFHDLSHANRTLHELFGLPPSAMFRSPDIAVNRCDCD